MLLEYRKLYKATFLRSNAGFVLADHGQHGLEAPDNPVKPAGVGVPGGARVQPGVGEGHPEGDLGGGEDGALPRVLLQPGGAQGARSVLLEVEHAATKSPPKKEKKKDLDLGLTQ